MHNDFREAGQRVFGLNKINSDGSCGCGNEDCKAAGKHPIMSHWQVCPDWSDEQWDNGNEAGQFDSGYGVLLNGLLVIDVDARNGGVPEYSRLMEKIPEIIGAGLIVETGSKGGSKHLYFSVDPTIPLVTKHADYEGIDFKSGPSFVVGPGSTHASGNKYSVLFGSPFGISPAPKGLIDLLRKPEVYRAAFDGKHIDLADSDIAGMLGFMSADCDHDTWVKTGMAIHHATGGAGFDLWDVWSQSSKDGKYPGVSSLNKRWHSFGKSINPVTIGTLIHYAKSAGWIEPVTFDAGDEFKEQIEDSSDGKPFSIEGIDLLRPPGFVGDVAHWINQQGQSSTEWLAMGTALAAIGNIAGLRHEEDLTDVSLNMFIFCVAGSGVGKDPMLSAFGDLHRAVGFQGALHGAFKSEQEVVRNLIRHQAAFYAVDEIDSIFGKVGAANSGGGAHYLSGLMSELMSIYSKAKKIHNISGDKQEEVKAAVKKEIGQLKKQVSENEDSNGYARRRIESLMKFLTVFEQSGGLYHPFLSIVGYATPKKFNAFVTPEIIMDGFMGRSLLIQEKETNPDYRENHRPPAMPEGMRIELNRIAHGGEFDIYADRVEHTGKKSIIATNDEASGMLSQVRRYFRDLGQLFKSRNGYEAATRRGYELTSKVSAILAAASGVRTPEHVRWAFALVDNDINQKSLVAFANDEAKEKGNRLESDILSRISKDHGESASVLHNRMSRYKKGDIDAALVRMEKSGLAIKKESTRGNRITVRWFAK